ncbi:MAG: GTPase Era [Acidimicrobiales bacterium]|jgi:GTP-binding protein Era|nr:GTPase Era [Acidimicrobiales bacterium]MDP6298496.1 GTPase Era [Acidimicrobiales bacterium]HJM27484.1 GTPase Era [Acidimicrobiales bacterium]
MKIPNDESGIDDETITTASKNYRSGFISILGRPNVGKSSLVNKICGEKIAITSNKPQTTRHQIRGVLHNQNSQLIFVDTPGIHKPRTSLGERLNIKAVSALNNIDIMCLVLDATSPIGPGDRFIAEKLPAETIVLVNKCDKAKKSQIAERLIEASEFNFAEYFPVSARTGEGLEVLIEYLKKEIPEGPMFYPDGQTTDMSDRDYVAELVREQLLRIMKKELPHSIATRVTEWEWPRIRIEILVERESQKGIVIGHKGENLKKVGTEVRKQLAEGAFVELQVNVDKNWQKRPDEIERLGY